MSYSVCLKCTAMVPGYDKYCLLCQREYGLPDLPDWQRINFTHENFDEWRKREVERDLKEIEFIWGDPKAKVNYKIVGVTDSKSKPERGIVLFFKAVRLKVIYRLISLTPARELKRIQLQQVIKDMKALKGGADGRKK